MTFARLLAVILLLTAVAVSAQSNPVPFINNPLVPASVAPGSPAFTLTVNGQGFVLGSVVNIDGAALNSNFVSSSQITAAVPAEDVISPQTAYVTVSNPGNGAKSNALPFQVNNETSDIGFSTFSIFTSPGAGCYVATDVNGDGTLDLIVCNVTDAQILVYLGVGDGTFKSPEIFPTTSTPGGIFLGDFNNDGCLDLIPFLPDGPAILLGNCRGSFSTSTSIGFDVYGQTVPGDFNGDGKLDLAVADAVTDQLAILLGNGDGTFQAPMYFPAGTFVGGISTGDFNRDGNLDITIEAFGDNAVSVLLGNGQGGFQSLAEYPVAGGPNGVAVADINGDGSLDIAVGTLSSPWQK